MMNFIKTKTADIQGQRKVSVLTVSCLYGIREATFHTWSDNITLHVISPGRTFGLP